MLKHRMMGQKFSECNFVLPSLSLALLAILGNKEGKGPIVFTLILVSVLIFRIDV